MLQGPCSPSLQHRPVPGHRIVSPRHLLASFKYSNWSGRQMNSLLIQFIPFAGYVRTHEIQNHSPAIANRKRILVEERYNRPVFGLPRYRAGPGNGINDYFRLTFARLFSLLLRGSFVTGLKFAMLHFLTQTNPPPRIRVNIEFGNRAVLARHACANRAAVGD